MTPRITSVETTPVALPFHEPYVTSAGTLEVREMILLRITTDDGLTGWGDAVPLSLRGGASLAEVSDALEECCAPLLVGSPLDREALLDVCAESRPPPPALAAVDVALLDLAGKASSEPAWRVLGAGAAPSVACNATLGAGEPAATAAVAGNLAELGFATFKIKVGTGEDLERVRAVRDAAGEAAKLRVDANGAWSVATAIEMLTEMSRLRLELAEQPCATSEELAALGGRIDVPIVADENVASEADAARVAALGACDAATVKLAKVGGPRVALRIAATLPSYLSSALDSPLGIAAAAHTVGALPGGGFVADLAHGLATSGLFADNVADDEPFRGPAIDLSDAPGLGVEIDEAAVERLRIR